MGSIVHGDMLFLVQHALGAAAEEPKFLPLRSQVFLDRGIRSDMESNLRIREAKQISNHYQVS